MIIILVLSKFKVCQLKFWTDFVCERWRRRGTAVDINFCNQHNRLNAAAKCRSYVYILYFYCDRYLKFSPKKISLFDMGNK
jgi:hypothetical protein